MVGSDNFGETSGIIGQCAIHAKLITVGRGFGEARSPFVFQLIQGAAQGEELSGGLERQPLCHLPHRAIRCYLGCGGSRHHRWIRLIGNAIFISLGRRRRNVAG